MQGLVAKDRPEEAKTQGPPCPLPDFKLLPRGGDRVEIQKRSKTKLGTVLKACSSRLFLIELDGSFSRPGKRLRLDVSMFTVVSRGADGTGCGRSDDENDSEGDDVLSKMGILLTKNASADRFFEIEKPDAIGHGADHHDTAVVDADIKGRRDESGGVSISYNPDKCQTYYAKEDETPASIAAHLHVSVATLVALNARIHTGLAKQSPLMQGTVLLVPQQLSTDKPPPAHPFSLSAPSMSGTAQQSAATGLFPGALMHVNNEGPAKGGAGKLKARLSGGGMFFCLDSDVLLLVLSLVDQSICCAVNGCDTYLREVTNTPSLWKRLNMPRSLVGQRQSSSGRASRTADVQFLYERALAIIRQKRFSALESVDLEGMHLGSVEKYETNEVYMGLLKHLMKCCPLVRDLNLRDVTFSNQLQWRCTLEQSLARLCGQRLRSVTLSCSENAGLDRILKSCKSLSCLILTKPAHLATSVVPNDQGLLNTFSDAYPNLLELTIEDNGQIGRRSLVTVLSQCPNLQIFSLIRCPKVDVQCVTGCALSAPGSLSSVWIIKCHDKLTRVDVNNAFAQARCRSVRCIFEDWASELEPMTTSDAVNGPVTPVNQKVREMSVRWSQVVVAVEIQVATDEGLVSWVRQIDEQRRSNMTNTQGALEQLEAAVGSSCIHAAMTTLYSSN